jgi:hypothetical protein
MKTTQTWREQVAEECKDNPGWIERAEAEARRREEAEQEKREREEWVRNRPRRRQQRRAAFRRFCWLVLCLFGWVVAGCVAWVVFAYLGAMSPADKTNVLLCLLVGLCCAILVTLNEKKREK